MYINLDAWYVHAHLVQAPSLNFLFWDIVMKRGRWAQLRPRLLNPGSRSQCPYGFTRGPSVVSLLLWLLSNTFIYLKIADVRERIKLRYEINHYSTQFLTGHGHFKSYLRRFGISDEDKCKLCDVTDTPEHVLFNCWKYVDSIVQIVSR